VGDKIVQPDTGIGIGEGGKEGLCDKIMGDGVGSDVDGDKEVLDNNILGIEVGDKKGNGDDKGNNRRDSGDKKVGADIDLGIDGGDKEGLGDKIMGDSVGFGIEGDKEGLANKILGIGVCDKKGKGDDNGNNECRSGVKKVGVDTGLGINGGNKKGLGDKIIGDDIGDVGFCIDDVTKKH